MHEVIRGLDATKKVRLMYFDSETQQAMKE